MRKKGAESQDDVIPVVDHVVAGSTRHVTDLIFPA